MRNPEQWRKRRKFGYAAGALFALAMDAMAAYTTIKGFEMGRFQQEPIIPIALDGVVLAGNAVLAWSYVHYFHGNRSNMIGGYDDNPGTIRARSRDFFQDPKQGERPDDNYPHRNHLN